nr:zinc finger, CCHC-type, retrotransposon Gag domain protein [Tanacetum cinerariifolium]
MYLPSHYFPEILMNLYAYVIPQLPIFYTFCSFVITYIPAPVDAENWISHMEKIFNVMGCEDALKTRLAVYKFEGNALAWWKAYKQAKGG